MPRIIDQCRRKRYQKKRKDMNYELESFFKNILLYLNGRLSKIQCIFRWASSHQPSFKESFELRNLILIHILRYLYISVTLYQVILQKLNDLTKFPENMQVPIKKCSLVISIVVLRTY